MKALCLWHATDDEVDSIRKPMPRGTEVVAPKGEYFSRYESTFPELEAHAIDIHRVCYPNWADRSRAKS